MNNSSDRAVTQRFLLLTLLAGVAAATNAANTGEPATVKLKEKTDAAFNRHVQLTEARNQEELHRGNSMLWIDGLPESERKAAAYAQLRHGEVKIEKLEAKENGEAVLTPGAMIHHWVGVIFVDGAKLNDVLAVLQDYDHHAAYYAPDVEQSKIESHDGDQFRVFLRFRRHKVITVVLNTEHEVQYFRDSPVRAHSRSSAVRIAEVENVGKSDEREKAQGDDGGFLWRMETWWRMEERDGGVYVQSEVASLTRNIPFGLGWLIGPFVTSIPRETLAFTLEATRKAVEIKTAIPRNDLAKPGTWTESILHGEEWCDRRLKRGKLFGIFTGGEVSIRAASPEADAGTRLDPRFGHPWSGFLPRSVLGAGFFSLHFRPEARFVPDLAGAVWG